MTLREKRKEYNSTTFKQILAEIKPLEKCCNCGSREELEWHHIVPLHVGGTNSLGNICVLCYQCHMAYHYDKPRHKMQAARNGGRKPLRPVGYEKVLDDYFSGKIGKRECKARLGFKHSPSSMSEYATVRDYMRKNGILEFRNNVDLISANGNLYAGRVVGYIKRVGRGKADLIWE